MRASRSLTGRLVCAARAPTLCLHDHFVSNRSRWRALRSERQCRARASRPEIRTRWRSALDRGRDRRLASRQGLARRIARELISDQPEDRCGYVQIRFGRSEWHLHRRHQGTQPVDRMIMKMLVTNAAIGDVNALCGPSPSPIPCGMPASAVASAGRMVRSRTQIDCGRCRRNSATSRIKLRAAIPIRHAENKPWRPRSAPRRANPCWPRSSAARRMSLVHPERSPRQMPDDVADSRLDLNYRKGRHIDCRSMSCDMSFVMHVNA